MSRGRKGGKEPDFERALARLEAIVKELEEGDRPLEDSLLLFEEGVRLTRQCATRLDEAQRRIEMLARGERDGELRLVPLEPGGGDDAPGGGDPEEHA